MTGLYGNSDSLYVKSVIENIFPAWTIHNLVLGSGNKAIDYHDNDGYELRSALKYNTEREPFNFVDYHSNDTREKIYLNIIKNVLIAKNMLVIIEMISNYQNYIKK